VNTVVGRPLLVVRRIAVVAFGISRADGKSGANEASIGDSERDRRALDVCFEFGGSVQNDLPLSTDYSGSSSDLDHLAQRDWNSSSFVVRWFIYPSFMG
jgi:hypothetical protein